MDSNRLVSPWDGRYIGFFRTLNWPSEQVEVESRRQENLGKREQMCFKKQKVPILGYGYVCDHNNQLIGLWLHAILTTRKEYEHYRCFTTALLLSGIVL